MNRRGSHAGARKKRARPTPKWLLGAELLDRVAQARCLLVLSVLSGEKPVSEAITEAGISRGHYYQLETRALRAMLKALSPASSEEQEEGGPGRQVAALEEKVKRLEQARRRSERLLAMTRKVMAGAPVKLRGRRTHSTSPGPRPLRRSGRAKTRGKESSPSTTSLGASTP
jgi:hypothetical protein